MRTKLILAMATAGMMYGTSAFAVVDPVASAPLQFGTGKVTFTGTITNSPCDIAPGDDNIQVSFGQVSNRHFKAADDTTDSKPFTIHLRDCSFDPNDEGVNTPNSAGKMSKVTVSFSGTGETTHHSYVNTGSAKNVGIQLLKSDGHTYIEPNSMAPESDAQQLQAGNNNLNFFARLIALDTNVAPGGIEASVTYTLKYM
ncbi:fimbrial protein [Salmonella enterica subsp. enterica serovar Enteritidis]|nr:fimbrial protein [Salmonella enterica subsp. enterica serovar Enteritidis]